MNLQEYLEKNRISPFRLSKTSGISSSAIYYILSDRTRLENMRFLSVVRIAKALDMSLDEFYISFVADRISDKTKGGPD